MTGMLGAGAARAAETGIDLARYGKLLEQHTRSVPATVGTQVDYRALGRSDEWRQLVAELARFDPSGLTSRDEKIAFYSNAYNILAIDIVLQNYPVDSIRDIGSFFTPVWNHTAGQIGGRDVTLNEIEHEILRPMGEPRIHMAIVCASTSCPSLNREPFDPTRLDAQLDEVSAAFAANQAKGVRPRGGNRLELSSIFKWFAEDFEELGGVIAFIEQHGPPEVRRWLADHPNPTLVYFDYDWSLNEVKG